MNLENFEEQIEQRIIDRGFDYYESEQIFEIEHVEKNEFCATVIGTEEYDVFVKLDNKKEIIEHSCNCPYDWGNFCKHEVAVLYYLKDSDLENWSSDGSSINNIKKELLNSSKEELIKMILDISKRNKELRNDILLDLGFELDEEQW